MPADAEAEVCVCERAGELFVEVGGKEADADAGEDEGVDGLAAGFFELLQAGEWGWRGGWASGEVFAEGFLGWASEGAGFFDADGSVGFGVLGFRVEAVVCCEEVDKLAELFFHGLELKAGGIGFAREAAELVFDRAAPFAVFGVHGKGFFRVGGIVVAVWVELERHGQAARAAGVGAFEFLLVAFRVGFGGATLNVLLDPAAGALESNLLRAGFVFGALKRCMAGLLAAVAADAAGLAACLFAWFGAPAAVAHLLTGVTTARKLFTAVGAAGDYVSEAWDSFHCLFAAQAPLFCQVRTLGACFVVRVTIVRNRRMAALLLSCAGETTRRRL